MFLLMGSSLLGGSAAAIAGQPWWSWPLWASLACLGSAVVLAAMRRDYERTVKVEIRRVW